jgi:hypothetical protein
MLNAVKPRQTQSNHYCPVDSNITGLVRPKPGLTGITRTKKYLLNQSNISNTTITPPDFFEALNPKMN